MSTLGKSAFLFFLFFAFGNLVNTKQPPTNSSIRAATSKSRKIFLLFLLVLISTKIEPGHSIFFKTACVPSEDSGQPALMCRLILVFAGLKCYLVGNVVLRLKCKVQSVVIIVSAF